jgi:hypothetical protein
MEKRKIDIKEERYDNKMCDVKAISGRFWIGHENIV